MDNGKSLTRKIYGMLARVFPRCTMISQAIAFNVFLAFFPTMLLAVAFASIWLGSKNATLDAVRDFMEFLPPGSRGIVSDFLQRNGFDFWKLPLFVGVGS